MATNVASGLPDVTLREGTTITVDAGAGNTVTQLVIHVFQVVPRPRPTTTPVLLRSGR